MSERAILVLEDGSAFRGFAFGALTDAEGEVVFNTGMTGYQEISTDPSYRGQMVVMTYPLIGNYGVATSDVESVRPWIAALIVRSYYEDYSNWNAERALDGYLRDAGVPGLFGIDTRALTRRLRSGGTKRAVLTRYEGEADVAALTARAGNVTPLSEKDLVHETATGYQYDFDLPGAPPETGPRIVVVDCGVKINIMRSLRRRGAGVVVVPHTATSAEIVALRPDGVLVVNGPGDPATLPAEVETVRGLLASGLPMMGICLGHQIIGQAIGGTTSRLRFGHHGGNHPVKDFATGRVHITSQNHEFQVDAVSIPPESGFVVSQINLNDGSVEGLAHPTRPVFSVQYHPEGSPGPQDNQYLFDRFLELVARGSR
jgi:carbamoyl-phosphate synthase small subunit